MSVNLSKRLKQVASYISEYIKEPVRMADIGSDHAYLPIYLAQNNLIEYAVAGEVVEGPYNNAKNKISEYNLEDTIEARLGNGLEVVRSNDSINTVTICGMGGQLIAQILEEGKEKLVGVEYLVLQPNVGERNVRKWLVDNNYKILNESILQEKQHIYEVIIARSCDSKDNLSDYELYFGPYLLQERSDIFINKWSNELQHIEKILNNLDKDKHSEEFTKLTNEYNMISKMLKEYEDEV